MTPQRDVRDISMSLFESDNSGDPKKFKRWMVVGSIVCMIVELIMQVAGFFLAATVFPIIIARMRL